MGPGFRAGRGFCWGPLRPSHLPFPGPILLHLQRAALGPGPRLGPDSHPFGPPWLCQPRLLQAGCAAGRHGGHASLRPRSCHWPSRSLNFFTYVLGTVVDTPPRRSPPLLPAMGVTQVKQGRASSAETLQWRKRSGSVSQPFFFPFLLATALSLAEELWGSVLGGGGFLGSWLGWALG